jgi:hypothetical protein
MNTTSRFPFRTRLHIASVSFALAIAGCYENYTAPPDQTETPGTGGSATASGGATSSGGQATKGEESGGSDPGTGGTEVTSQGGSTATGGTTASGGTTDDEEGGSPSDGGAPEVDDTGGTTSTSTGGKSATGGSPGQSGGSDSGGSATGGVEATGGVSSTGGAAQGGSGGGPVVEESICVDESGAPVPYDFSFGIASEYAFELSMSCDVGGYLMPLVLADPEQLTMVNGFVLAATDWYRAHILNCPDESSSLGKDSYGLLPESESSDLSGDDFEASMALFMSIVDRHDNQPDAVSANKKDKIKKRIKSVKNKAVHNNAAGLTKTLPEAECVPAAPAEGGG